MRIAIIGKTSNIPKPKIELNLSTNDYLIFDGESSGSWDEGWVYPFFKEWATERNIPFQTKFYFSQKYESKEDWYKEIIDQADKLVVYCDDKEEAITKLGLFAINYARKNEKEVHIISLPYMYHFHFLIKEKDYRDFNEAFTIIKDGKIFFQRAKAEAIIEAQIKYLSYICSWENYPSSLSFTLYIEDKCEYQLFWKEIDTHLLEFWYKDELNKHNQE